MLDPRIIDEAYNELNNAPLNESSPVLIIESDDKEYDMKKVKKLVNDISSLLHKFDDIEDKESMSDIMIAVQKSVVKMVDELKTEVCSTKKKEDAKEDDDEKDDDKEKKSKDDEKKDEDKDDKGDEDGSEEADKDEKENDNDDEEKAEEVTNMLKMFPTTESITSPQGVEYLIVEANIKKSTVKDLLTGEQFKIDTDILKKWKNS